MPRSTASTTDSTTSPPVASHTRVGAWVESSSRPSSPRTTIARVPRSSSACAMTGAIRRSAHPTSWAAGRAGLASGPRMLNTVATPSSRRATPAWRMPGWKSGAKQNTMPASARQSPTAAGGRSTATPSASSTSAEPAAELAARFPCLTTGAPAAATTTALIVEMLTVCDRSPPVPQVSTTAPVPARSSHRCGVIEHRLHEAGDLGRSLALGAQRDEEAGELDVGGVAGHHAVHGPGAVVGTEVVAAQQRRGEVGPGALVVGCGAHDPRPYGGGVRRGSAGSSRTGRSRARSA